MKSIDVYRQSIQDIPPLLLDPVTWKGTLNQHVIKMLHIRRGKIKEKIKKTVLEVFQEYQKEEEEMRARDHLTKAESTRITKERMKKSIERALKIEFLTVQKERYAQQGKGKIPMCCLSSTTAIDPDPEHLLLEFRPLPCTEIMAHLKRWGCQHDYLELEDHEVRALKRRFTGGWKDESIR